VDAEAELVAACERTRADIPRLIGTLADVAALFARLDPGRLPPAVPQRSCRKRTDGDDGNTA
jgi:hypothetical protein